MVVVKCVSESILEHGVLELLVAILDSIPHMDDVFRLAHVLLPACYHNVGFSAQNRLTSQNDGSELNVK